ncbi:sulfate ABC transporter ATP-binding protein [uncultured Campylobacter sp.]|uniref:sulfate ABC transporter ATP-binding protein n=1 Tax=uncultured Campylobacter sp. TaxID=218934 RepID=UPI00262FF309|nr:sulfate ABC transporter ATP-binding protein [uncultured Campylobacter sp.]
MQEFFSRLDPNNATQKEIENFMRDLLENCALEVAGEKFAFAEIEIYTSADKNSYKRVSSVGDIFFHNFGFDICFESSEEAYGGGLVRSLLRFSDHEIINGPRRCANTILNIHKPNLSFCLLDAKGSQEADEVSNRVRRADLDESGNPIDDRRRLTSSEFKDWLESDKEEAKKYKKAINKYKNGAENEKSTPNQAN